MRSARKLLALLSFVPISTKVYAVKLYMPFMIFVGSTFLMMDKPTWSQFMYREVLFAPAILFAAWSLVVPMAVEAEEGVPILTVIGWLSTVQIPFEEIAYLKRGISVFDTLVLRSGRKIVYITDAGNKHLRIGPPLEV
jgi:hypothetical protein